MKRRLASTKTWILASTFIFSLIMNGLAFAEGCPSCGGPREMWDMPGVVKFPHKEIPPYDPEGKNANAKKKGKTDKANAANARNTNAANAKKGGKGHKGNLARSRGNCRTDSESASFSDPDALPPVLLRPRIKATELIEIPRYPLETIKPFLYRDAFVFCSREDFACGPYVMGLDAVRSTAGTGDYLYVRGIENLTERSYTVFAPGHAYFDPVTREFLGYESEAIATAEMTVLGPVSEFKVVNATEGITLGARVFPSYILPPVQSLAQRPASAIKEGFILNIKDGQGDGGRNQVVLINLGLRDGLREGDILDIFQTNRKRTICEPCPCPPILPDLRLGQVLVFRSFEKMSLALIVRATEIVNIMDRVRNPS